jgi:hypothetical protein
MLRKYRNNKNYMDNLHIQGNKKCCDNCTEIAVTNTFNQIHLKTLTHFIKEEYRNSEMEE